MDYRDERDALRAKQEALEQELAVARPKLPNVPLRIAAVLAGALALVAILGGGWAWLMMEGPALDPERAVETAPRVEPSAAATTPALQFSVATGALAPLPVDASGSDGVLAIVFEDAGGGRVYSAVALSGRPLVERWRVGPLGSAAPSVWSTGHRALVIDAKHGAHVIDVDKGRELAAVSGLTDGAARVCIRDAQAWIAGLDDRSIGINLETGAGSVGAELLKRECTALPGPKQTACASLSAARCGGSAPAVPEMAIEAALANERVAVAVGAKSSGAREILAAGFDPKTHALRWRSPIAAPDDDAQTLETFRPIVAALDDELFVAVEALRSGGATLRAFDAKTGERRFVYSFASPVHPPLSVVIGAERVFTTSDGALYAIDRGSGKELARVVEP